MSSSEFVEWCLYMDREVHGFHREDYLAASVCAAVARGQVRDPQRVTVSDFLVTFKSSEGEKPRRAEETVEERRARAAQSKAAWLRGLGLEKKGARQ